MLNRSASLAMSTSVFKALPGKLDIKRHSPSILYLVPDNFETKHDVTVTLGWQDSSNLPMNWSVHVVVGKNQQKIRVHYGIYKHKPLVISVIIRYWFPIL